MPLFRGSELSAFQILVSVSLECNLFGIMQYCTKNKLNLLATNRSGLNILNINSIAGDLEKLDFFLKNVVNPNVCNSFGNNVLHNLIKNVDCFEKLIKIFFINDGRIKPDINSFNNYGNSVFTLFLHRVDKAYRINRSQMLLDKIISISRLLIQNGANPYLENQYGFNIFNNIFQLRYLNIDFKKQLAFSIQSSYEECNSKLIKKSSNQEYNYIVATIKNNHIMHQNTCKTAFDFQDPLSDCRGLIFQRECDNNNQNTYRTAFDFQDPLSDCRGLIFQRECDNNNQNTCDQSIPSQFFILSLEEIGKQIALFKQ